VPSTLMGITFNLSCGVRKDDETGVFVSYCPALDVYSQGTSGQEAEEAIRSAVLLFLTTCYDLEILDHTLKGRGFIPASQAALKSGDAPEEYIAVNEKFEREFEITVPLSLIAATQVLPNASSIPYSS
jgi:predicted RNase H-like HicB family nuclease